MRFNLAGRLNKNETSPSSMIVVMRAVLYKFNFRASVKFPFGNGLALQNTHSDSLSRDPHDGTSLFHKGEQGEEAPMSMSWP